MHYAVVAASAFLKSLEENNDTPLDLSLLEDYPLVANLLEVVDKVKEEVSSSGSSRLYLVYLKMHEIRLRNLNAERLGN